MAEKEVVLAMMLRDTVRINDCKTTSIDLRWNYNRLICRSILIFGICL